MFFWNFLPISMIQQTLAIGSLVLLHFLNPTWTFGMIAQRASHFSLFHLPSSYLSFWPQCRCDLTFWSPLWSLCGLSTKAFPLPFISLCCNCLFSSIEEGFPGGSYPPAMQENWVQSLSQENPLEKGMATHSHILAWRIPWTEEHGGLQFMGL